MGGAWLGRWDGLMPARAGVLRIGDRVRFDGCEHTVVGLSGTSVRLAADDGAGSVVSWVHLQSAADFVVLTGSPAPVLPPFGLLETVPDRVLERARWWERHIVETADRLPAGRGRGVSASGAVRPGPSSDERA